MCGVGRGTLSGHSSPVVKNKNMLDQQQHKACRPIPITKKKRTDKEGLKPKSQPHPMEREKRNQPRHQPEALRVFCASSVRSDPAKNSKLMLRKVRKEPDGKKRKATTAHRKKQITRSFNDSKNSTTVAPAALQWGEGYAVVGGG